MPLPLIRGFLLAMPILFAGVPPAQASEEPLPLPRAVPPKKLHWIDEGSLNPADQVAVMTLQGLLARDSDEQIFLFNSATGEAAWLETMRESYGVETQQALSVITLLNLFDDVPDGYILYSFANPESVNVATSLASIYNAIAVEQGRASFYQGRGLTEVMDVRERTERWAWEQYGSEFNRDVVVELDPTLRPFLRDYAVLARAFVYLPGLGDFRDEVMEAMNPDALMLGWSVGGENQFIGNSSQKGIQTIPADFARNLSSLSGPREDSLLQKPVPELPPEEGVHYVTFIMSDGDNIQWLLNTFTRDEDHFGSPLRGELDLGWGMAPYLIDLAPAVLRRLYADAARGNGSDEFVVGPSGAGYIFPGQYPSAALALHASRLATLMERTGLEIVQVIDFDTLDDTAIWDEFTQHDAIRGFIYYDYAPYNGKQGRMSFSNHKPLVSARHMLWEGIPGANRTAVANALNAAPKNVALPDSYSVVVVHVWTQSVEAVKETIELLDPNIRVVAPSQLFHAIERNLVQDPGKLSFTFEEGAEGWRPSTAGKEFDRAEWTAARGGALLLDGSDLGSPDGEANSAFRRSIQLPMSQNVQLRFETAGQADGDGDLRVRLEASGGFETLLDWESLGGEVFVRREADLTPWAGQLVEIIFEQRDSGEGAGEHRYIGSVQVEATSRTAWRIY